MRNLTNADLAKLLDKDIFHKISEAADSLHFECYVVGGYVRDLFLERPSNDIDVVVVGSGIRVADALKKILGKKAHISVFRNFGTAQVKYIVTIAVSLMLKMELLKTTRTVVISPLMRWQFVLTVIASVNSLTHLMAYLIWKTVL